MVFPRRVMIPQQRTVHRLALQAEVLQAEVLQEQALRRVGLRRQVRVPH